MSFCSDSEESHKPFYKKETIAMKLQSLQKPIAAHHSLLNSYVHKLIPSLLFLFLTLIITSGEPTLAQTEPVNTVFNPDTICNCDEIIILSDDRVEGECAITTEAWNDVVTNTLGVKGFERDDRHWAGLWAARTVLLSIPVIGDVVLRNWFPMDGYKHTLCGELYNFEVYDGGVMRWIGTFILFQLQTFNFLSMTCDHLNTTNGGCVIYLLLTEAIVTGMTAEERTTV